MNYVSNKDASRFCWAEAINYSHKVKPYRLSSIHHSFQLLMLRSEIIPSLSEWSVTDQLVAESLSTNVRTDIDVTGNIPSIVNLAGIGMDFIFFLGNKVATRARYTHAYVCLYHNSIHWMENITLLNASQKSSSEISRNEARITAKGWWAGFLDILNNRNILSS